MVLKGNRIDSLPYVGRQYSVHVVRAGLTGQVYAWEILLEVPGCDIHHRVAASDQKYLSMQTAYEAGQVRLDQLKQQRWVAYRTSKT